MDADRFDSLTRSLTDARSRRGALGGLLGATLGLFGLANAAAKPSKPVHGEGKKKKKKKKKKHPSTRNQTPVSPPPLGAPSCPAGQKPCKGGCISLLVCCDDGDCAEGRTCQLGTCGCPPARPYVCPGSTVCRQCCVKADCAARPDQTGDGIPECVDRVCACTQPGTRFCPNTGVCGYCCSDAECTNEETCAYYGPNNGARLCQCSNSETRCTAAGRTGCISDLGTCTAACGQPCNPENGDAACPCSTDLVCDFDPTTQDCCYCRAR